MLRPQSGSAARPWPGWEGEEYRRFSLLSAEKDFRPAALACSWASGWAPRQRQQRWWGWVLNLQLGKTCFTPSILEQPTSSCCWCLSLTGQAPERHFSLHELIPSLWKWMSHTTSRLRGKQVQEKRKSHLWVFEFSILHHFTWKIKWIHEDYMDHFTQTVFGMFVKINFDLIEVINSICWWMMAALKFGAQLY